MEEIGLGQLLRVIIKWKKSIIIFTGMCMLLSLLVGIFAIGPEYETRSTIMVKPVEIKTGLNSGQSVIFSGDLKTLDMAKKLENKMLGSILGQIKYPQYGLDVIEKNMRSQNYLLKIMNDLNIDTKKFDFRKKIIIGIDPKTALINISVRNQNSDTALNIKKAIIEYLPKYIKEKSDEQINRTLKNVEVNLNNEINNYESLKKRLLTFTGTLSSTEDELKKIPVESQRDFQEIKNAFIYSGQAIEAYQLINKELDYIVKSVDIENMMDIQTITETKLPLKPVSPGKAFFALVGMSLGLILSIFYAFVIEFIRKENLVNSNIKIDA